MEQNTNPYQAPKSDVTHQTQEFNDSGVWSMRGRIGRLRYLAYVGAVSFITFALLVIVGAITGAIFSGDSELGAGSIAMIILLVLVYGFIIFMSFVFGIRRLNDLDQTGWLILLMFVPLVSAILSLVLIFMPGTQGSNKYGAPPAENPLWVKLCAFVLPALLVLGMLAAIALPAYKDYTDRAEQYQQNSQTQQAPSDYSDYGR